MLLLAPFAPGEVTLPSADGAWTALVGDVVNGAWQTFERLPLTDRSLRLDADRATCLILVARNAQLSEAVARLNLSVRTPWQQAGL